MAHVLQCRIFELIKSTEVWTTKQKSHFKTHWGNQNVQVTYAVSISALSLATVASASRSHASFTIANGDENEKVEQAVTAEQQVRLNVQAGYDNDKPGAVLDYTNFTIANSDENEEISNDIDTKVQAAITVEQPVKLNIGGGDDSDMPRVRLNVGASDPAEQA